MAKKPIEVETLQHGAAKRRNIPTAELEGVMREDERSPIRLAYERRNRDLDPQLVWRGKDEQDWSDLIVQAPPLYIQEKVHPKVLIDDLLRQSKARARQEADKSGSGMPDLFADFNGLPDREAATEFYQHNAHWTNRMILGDSLQVMASLAEREGLRGQVQCIYLDPPYGIKFNSNFQWSTTSRDVKDGSKDHISREPEQVKAFRDTWRDGIHSYLTYLRDRLTVGRDLLAETGSIFVQIGDENVHRVRAVMDEVFGSDNFCNLIGFKKTGGLISGFLPSTGDYLLWYAKDIEKAKFRQPYSAKAYGGDSDYRHVRLPDLSVRRLTGDEAEYPDKLPSDWQILQTTALESANPLFAFNFRGRVYNQRWKTNLSGLSRLSRADRLYEATAKLRYLRYVNDFPVIPIINNWDDTGSSGYRDANIYVVQTVAKVVERCLLMATDPGDLVLDPTCGSGTTAYVAEQWGRRWITIDTSRVALALARSRIMGARYPYYLLADSPEGQRKEGEVTRTAPRSTTTRGDIRQGFVYERVPHITLKSIANNAEIDAIWDKWQETLELLRTRLNAELGMAWEEWEIPRELSPAQAANSEAAKLHADWWKARIGRQKEIDASIAAKAEFEYLYDKPYVDNSRVRVAGPFTVESLSPHRVLAVDENDELLDTLEAAEGKRGPRGGGEEADFAQMVLDTLRAAGVQQAHKEDRIAFTALTGWPGDHICAEGRFMEGDRERRAGIFIGPEFGTVARADLVAAAREAGDAGFDVLVACAFNYDAHSAEFEKLGRIPVLKARMNPDLHMAGELKNTGAGNLFVVFGEPDIAIEDAGVADGKPQIRVHIRGVDVFHPQTGEVRSGDADSIALWMIDTDYNEESFFVRHAYFLGANDPYKALKTTLKAEIDQEAWESLYGDTSRPFDKPASGRIAVKVINHLGDEVMKVFGVG
ncbi:site-specific DNA-methyltransferase [Emcibacter sp. SYSU 3D8]|uniref:site-specific DNA-methyltransferase n=1 Tax=Emcibacter sp. SYSU 3D8 TaxID=3133969 RepID=UPI0031FEE5F8